MKFLIASVLYLFFYFPCVLSQGSTGYLDSAQLAFDLHEIFPDSAKHICEQLLEISKDPKEISSAFNTLGLIYKSRGNFGQALEKRTHVIWFPRGKI